MISKPKEYTNDSLGGYLLNDLDYEEPLFVEKPVYGVTTEVNNKENNIYYTINYISKTPFKINLAVLDYITSYKGSHLILDPGHEHEFTKLVKKTKRQDNVLIVL